MMTQDCLEKRAAFIDESVKIREMFNFAHPLEVITAVEKYCCSFYSSNLWDLNSPGVDSVCAAWRTNIKLAWNVDRACHRYFVSEVLAPETRPLKVSLLSRFHNFFLSLLDSPSHEVQVMARLSARDIRSSTGSNLRLLTDMSNCDPWTVSNSVMKHMLMEGCQIEMPDGDQWRLPCLEKLLAARLEAHYSANTEEESRLTDLITSLVTN